MIRLGSRNSGGLFAFYCIMAVVTYGGTAALLTVLLVGDAPAGKPLPKGWSWETVAPFDLAFLGAGAWLIWSVLSDILVVFTDVGVSTPGILRSHFVDWSRVERVRFEKASAASRIVSLVCRNTRLKINLALYAQPEKLLSEIFARVPEVAYATEARIADEASRRPRGTSTTSIANLQAATIPNWRSFIDRSRSLERGYSRKLRLVFAAVQVVTLALTLLPWFKIGGRLYRLVDMTSIVPNPSVYLYLTGITATLVLALSDRAEALWIASALDGLICLLGWYIGVSFGRSAEWSSLIALLILGRQALW